MTGLGKTGYYFIAERRAARELSYGIAPVFNSRLCFQLYGSVAQQVEATDLKPVKCEFEFHRSYHTFRFLNEGAPTIAQPLISRDKRTHTEKWE